MSIKATRTGVAALGHFRPELTHTFLPRCANCHAPHPLARKPVLDLAECPDCGTPCQRAETRVVPALLTGAWGLVARLFLGIGKWLAGLARSI